MDATTRVATLMLRRNSRKDVTAFGTLFSQWSANNNPRTDPMRRMTMGGAGPVADPQPVAPSVQPVHQPAFMDAFCAVQLAPTCSINKQDSAFLLSPKSSLTLPAMTPMASLKDPFAPLADGSTLLSPSSSSKGGLAAILTSPSFRASAEALLTHRASAAGAGPSPLAISS